MTSRPQGPSLLTLLGLPRRYRLWRPTHLRLIAADLLRPAAQSPRDRRAHLSAAIDWLCRAQDRRDGCADAGGVSAGWSFEDGWLPSYPETSGYIVETLLAAARVLDRPELAARAGRILDWELGLQLPDGAFPGHFGEPGSTPVIFNTGQIMHGLLAGHQQLGRDDCLAAAVRAAHWMVGRQDPDGCWRRSVHNAIPHVYNTRAAWALLRTGLASGEPGLVDAALANLRWARSQATPSGWWRENAFRRGEAPFTHNIAYAMRGLLEGGVLAGDPELVESAACAARALVRAQRADGWIAGAFADDWRPAARYSCLTGVAQIVLNWQRLEQLGVVGAWREPIERSLGFLARNQRLRGDGAPDDGALAGSLPIWGRYSRFEYPNWATKFLADALIMACSDEVVPPLPVRASVEAGA
ncbi:prenyltransferase/squalene oxidase repeat-containing protein [Marichromatium gracile]|uniref:Squalene cyclase C-terminal domain-containing protein n=1 Tax=Marichromatium gracile TaxID=1048 RepID=A0ABR5VCP6_MARGR|nr:prenyltransferase/squalene oxidase repeat-containing protein [Marichromatium gracile]KXX63326.1 hypothetical protein AY586_05390 [Marichromatium gracile]